MRSIFIFISQNIFIIFKKDDRILFGKIEKSKVGSQKYISLVLDQGNIFPWSRARKIYFSLSQTGKNIFSWQKYIFFFAKQRKIYIFKGIVKEKEKNVQLPLSRQGKLGIFIVFIIFCKKNYKKIIKCEAFYYFL